MSWEEMKATGRLPKARFLQAIEFDFATMLNDIILAKARIPAPVEDAPNRFWILAFARTTAAIPDRGCAESLASQPGARLQSLSTPSGWSSAKCSFSVGFFSLAMTVERK